MVCEEVRGIIREWKNGRLKEWGEALDKEECRRQIEQLYEHLAVCKSCEAHYAQQMKTPVKAKA